MCTVLASQRTFKPSSLARARRALKSSNVPKDGSMLTKSDMSYPKSTMGLGYMGDNQIALMPVSAIYPNFEVIPDNVKEYSSKYR